MSSSSQFSRKETQSPGTASQKARNEVPPMEEQHLQTLIPNGEIPVNYAKNKDIIIQQELAKIRERRDEAQFESSGKDRIPEDLVGLALSKLLRFYRV